MVNPINASLIHRTFEIFNFSKLKKKQAHLGAHTNQLNDELDSV